MSAARPAPLLAAALALGVLWLVAGAIGFAGPRWERLLAQLGADLPTPTAWLVAALQLRLHLLGALLPSLGLALLAWRRSRWLMTASLAGLVLAALAAAATLWALSLPLDCACALIPV